MLGQVSGPQDHAEIYPLIGTLGTPAAAGPSENLEALSISEPRVSMIGSSTWPWPGLAVVASSLLDGVVAWQHKSPRSSSLDGANPDPSRTEPSMQGQELI